MSALKWSTNRGTWIVGSIALLLMGLASYHLFYVYPLITPEHPYSDSLIYVRLALHPEQWFGTTHITSRILFPGVLWIGHHFLPLDVQAFSALIQLMLFFSFILLFKKHHSFNSFSLLFFLCLFSLPSFWRGAFLPMLEIPCFVLIAFFVYYRKSTLFLFFGMITLFLLKESLIISLIPLIFYSWHDLYLRRKYLALIVPLSILYFLLISFTIPTDQNYLFSLTRWIQDWVSTLSSLSMSSSRHFISAFGLFPFLLYFRCKIIPLRLQEKRLLYGMGVSFLIYFLFTPTNSPRLAFSLIPYALLFLSKKDGTFSQT